MEAHINIAGGCVANHFSEVMKMHNRLNQPIALLRLVPMVTDLSAAELLLGMRSSVGQSGALAAEHQLLPVYRLLLRTRRRYLQILNDTNDYLLHC